MKEGVEVVGSKTVKQQLDTSNSHNEREVTIECKICKGSNYRVQNIIMYVHYYLNNTCGFNLACTLQLTLTL